MVRKFLEDVFRRKLDVLHSARVVHTLYQQQKQGRYCDLKVLVEDQQYFVHRCVLASASAQLDAQINGLDTIQLVGVTNYGFEHLLEILYSGKMAKVATVDSSKFHEIVSAADALNAESVIEYCARERGDLMKFVLNPQDVAKEPMEVTQSQSTTLQSTTNITEVSEMPSTEAEKPDMEPEEVTIPPPSTETSSSEHVEQQPQASENPPVEPINTVQPESSTEVQEEQPNWNPKVKQEAIETANNEIAETSSTDAEDRMSNNAKQVSAQPEVPVTATPEDMMNTTAGHGAFVTPEMAVKSAEQMILESGENPFLHQIDPNDIKNIQSLRTSMFPGTLGMKRTVKCVICKRMFSSQHHLKSHMKKHTTVGMKPFRCDICGMKFSFQMTLMNHMKLHEEKKYVCKICGRDFKLNKNLVIHMGNVHPVEWEQEQQILKAQFNFPQSLNNPSLPGSSSSSSSSSRRKTHPVKRPIAQQPELVNPETSFVPAEQPMPQSLPTDFPQKLQSNVEIEQLKSAVENVQVGIDGKFSCPLCGKGFSRRWNLKCHVLTHAENRIPRSRAKFPPKKPLPFGCPECGKSFQTAGSLQKHAILVHPYSKTLFGYSGVGQPPYPEMGEVAQTANPSAAQTAVQPRAEPSPVVCWCKVCGRGFRRLRNLRNHMETHSGTGYECHICGRTFAQRDGLNGHLWIHGGLGGSKANPNQQTDAGTEKGNNLETKAKPDKPPDTAAIKGDSNTG